MLNAEKSPVATVEAGSVAFGGTNPLTLIAGPCVIESEDHTLRLAAQIRDICQQHGISLVFKASYDKANRSAGSSFRGPGRDEGLRILARVRDELGLPILTDIHSADDARAAGEIVDIVQVPAFLCRQTDILLAAAATGRVVNVKKGQFMAPWDMGNVCAKVETGGNRRIMLTERGASFGYNNLVSDMRSLVAMREFGYPVIFDATHSVQLPGGQGTSSGGQRQFILPLARAACAVGIDGLFVETHDNPDKAMSDGPNALPLEWLGGLIDTVRRLDAIARGAA